MIDKPRTIGVLACKGSDEPLLVYGQLTAIHHDIMPSRDLFAEQDGRHIYTTSKTL